MRFTIISTKAGHQPPQGSCDFYAPGGTIGRGTDNNLVLPDDDRAISRLQAIVHVAADGECKITNRGNVTRVVLNEIPLERGRQVELQDGDILAIDDYRIEVSDLLQDSQPISRMAASGQPPVTAKPTTPNSAAAPAVAEAAPTAVPSEIWDSLMQEFSIADSISSSRFRVQKYPCRIPDTFHSTFLQKNLELDHLYIWLKLFFRIRLGRKLFWLAEAMSAKAASSMPCADAKSWPMSGIRPARPDC